MSVTLHGPDQGPRASSAEPTAERPSEQIVRDANAVHEVTDAKGRLIKFKKLGALETMDLNEIAGANNIGNPGWMLFATIAFSVVELDGQRIMRPKTKDQLRHLVQRLGNEGIDAVLKAISPKQADDADDPDAPDAEAAAEQAALDATKNS